MPKSLADLRQSPHVGRPEIELPVCVAGKLNAEFDRIDAELDQLIQAAPQAPLPTGDDDEATPPERLARRGRRNPNAGKIHELNERRESLRAEMAEHMVGVLFRHREEGGWKAWTKTHGPKNDDPAAARAGFDLDALIADLRDNPRNWVGALNGEAYTDDDWAFVWANSGEGDQWRMANVVRRLHTGGVDIPKSLDTSRLPRMSDEPSS